MLRLSPPRQRFASCLLVLGVIGCDQSPSIPTSPTGTLPSAAAAHVRISVADTLFGSIGDSLQASARVTDATGAVISAAIPTWSVTAPSVATLGGVTGLVIAKAPGTSMLIASYAGISDTMRLTVRPVGIRFAFAQPILLLNGLGASAAAEVTVTDARGIVVGGALIDYASSTEVVATVNSSGVVSAMGAGTAYVRCQYAGIRDSIRVTVTLPAATPASLHFASKTGTIVAIDDTLRMKAVVRDAAGTVIATAPTYRVVEQLYASVDAGGLVTSHGTGTTHVIASVGTIADTATLTLKQVASRISVSRLVDSLVVGDSVTPGFNAYDARGNYIPVYPTLTTAQTGIARISGNRVVAVAPGTVVTTATLDGAMAQSNIVVRAAPTLQLLEFIPDTLVIASTASGVLQLRGRMSDGTTVPVSGSLYSVTLPGVVSVDQQGNYKALAPGLTYVVATKGPFTARAFIQVNGLPIGLQHVNIKPDALCIRAGYDYQFVMHTYDQAGIETVPGATQWSVSDTTVATFDAAGKLHTMKGGHIIAFGVAQGMSDFTPVTVDPAPLGTVMTCK
jgi:hypothetical protein